MYPYLHIYIYIYIHIQIVGLWTDRNYSEDTSLLRGAASPL